MSHLEAGYPGGVQRRIIWSMKVYFSASIVGKRYHLEKYKKIVKILEKNGCNVQADHILKTSEEDIRLESREERVKFHDQLRTWISTSDCMVVEASFPSISVGYEISMALHWAKPILILFSEGDPPSLLTHHKEDKIICERYTEDQLPGIINDFLDYARGNTDTRFTFFLPSDLALYLEIASKKARTRKAAYIRTLLERDRDQNFS